MKKLKMIVGLQSLACMSLLAQTTRVDSLLKEFSNPSSKYVFVAAHRGDWRHTAENSIQGIRNCVNNGVDIIEMDVQKTKDGKLVVIHDTYLDKETTGKGDVKDFTLAEIQQLQIRNGYGQYTTHHVPSFEEFMLVAKGKILVNVDKSDNKLKEVYEVLERTGTLHQAIVKTYYAFDKLNHDDSIYMKKFPLFMANVRVEKADGPKLISDYETYARPIAYEINYEHDTSEYVKKNFTTISNRFVRIWNNSLWSSQCAGHHDDKAVEENKPEETWGWIINKGVSIIQTDRHKELIHYLQQKGRRKLVQ